MEEINSKLIFDKISKDLMNSSVNIIYQGENEVDSNSKNNIVDQYKLLVDSSHKIEERRSSSNNVFIGINTILVSVLANSPVIPQSGVQ